MPDPARRLRVLTEFAVLASHVADLLDQPGVDHVALGLSVWRAREYLHPKGHCQDGPHCCIAGRFGPRDDEVEYVVGYRRNGSAA